MISIYDGHDCKHYECTECGIESIIEVQFAGNKFIDLCANCREKLIAMLSIRVV